jgi:hypothetical protein
MVTAQENSAAEFESSLVLADDDEEGANRKIMRLRLLFGSVVLGILTYQAGVAQAPARATQPHVRLRCDGSR